MLKILARTYFRGHCSSDFDAAFFTIGQRRSRKIGYGWNKQSTVNIYRHVIGKNNVIGVNR